eukprot:gb/GEZN01024076.1/.p1 GENE.gb/GEZN01024076.1/~~gb/GEZN01024076.1/.p1  ORF type:complete len:176 (-),score=3.82 gb/GEZN01024076.1/:27-554(-)
MLPFSAIFLLLAPLLASATTLSCVLTPCDNSASQNVKGTVFFVQGGNGIILVNATVYNLPANSYHGFHIHQYGNLSSPDCTATGGHFNPTGVNHSCPDGFGEGQRHVGDMGNIKSNDFGTATYLAKLDLISLVSGVNAIIGRAVIVHAEADDCVSQPTGNAGARWAQCVIGLSAE